MPIDITQVDWLHVATLAVFAFAATGVANLISFNRWVSAWTAAVVFAAIFVLWTYNPHWPSLSSSLPSAEQKSAPAKEATAAPATAAPTGAPSPPKPLNPVRDITPRR
jgi:hypothetical protein